VVVILGLLTIVGALPHEERASVNLFGCKSNEVCKIALKSHHGKYVAGEVNGDANANRDTIKPWELWTVTFVEANKVTFKNIFQKYLVAEWDGSVKADRTAASTWETFTVEKVGNGFSFKSFHGKYLVAEINGDLNANRDAVGAWEIFQVVCQKGCQGSQQGSCAKIPSWMKTAMQQTSGFERIINGKKAPTPIPWQVHLRQGNPFTRFTYFCGGTILDSKTILTAAHCYYGFTHQTGYFITAGSNHVQKLGQNIYVDKILMHEGYNDRSLTNDLAILKLKTPLTFNNLVRPACLPETRYSSGIAVASGWGLVGQGPDKGTHDLMYVTKPVIPRESCVWPKTKWHPNQILETMICAGDADGGESTCKGDSGGPLVVAKSATDDTAVVIGATSFGSTTGCGAVGLPAVYADTVTNLAWIKARMG